MKQVTGKLFLFLFIAVAMASCAKESSYESGNNINGKSEGTLKDTLGNCQGITIQGIYRADSTLIADSNYILVQINATKPGQYNIYTDTANGFWFRDTGYTTAGAHTIKLKGYGKPLLAINTDFIVTYNNSFCILTVPLTTIVVPPVISDYFPMSIGSNWNYDVTGSADSLHVDATPQTANYLSNIYTRFIGKQTGATNDTSYYRKSGTDYYQYDALDVFSAPMEINFLKEGQPAGTQWETPAVTTSYNGIPTQVKMHFILLGVNTSMIINNMQIDSVIRVQNDLQYKVLNAFQTVSTGYTYYAKNIGLVKIDFPGFYGQTIRRWKIY